MGSAGADDADPLPAGKPRKPWTAALPVLLYAALFWAGAFFLDYVVAIGLVRGS
jgi:hypothetical protein